MFPTAHSIISYNEAGEVLGWEEPDIRDMADIEAEWYERNEWDEEPEPDFPCEGHETEPIGTDWDHTDKGYFCYGECILHKSDNPDMPYIPDGWREPYLD